MRRSAIFESGNDVRPGGKSSGRGKVLFAAAGALACGLFFNSILRRTANGASALLPSPAVDETQATSGRIETVAFARECFRGIHAVFEDTKDVTKAAERSFPQRALRLERA